MVKNLQAQYIYLNTKSDNLLIRNKKKFQDTNRTTNRYLGVLYLFLSWFIKRILAR